MKKMIEEDEDENTVIVSTVFHLPEGFMIDVLEEEGYELTRDEEQNLMSSLSSIRIYFEVNTQSGAVFVLGTR